MQASLTQECTGTCCTAWVCRSLSYHSPCTNDKTCLNILVACKSHTDTPFTFQQVCLDHFIIKLGKKYILIFSFKDFRMKIKG